MLCNRISGSWQCTETVAPVGNPRGEMPSIGHPRRRVSKPHCRCAGRPNGWTWGSEERQAVAGGTRSCLDSCVKPSRRSPLGETRENHMVTQRFWSSAIYLATSNSHASGIVGPRHDHMAIIHRQAINKQARKHNPSIIHTALGLAAQGSLRALLDRRWLCIGARSGD